MSNTIRRLKTLWWLSGVITECPSAIVGGKPTRIVPSAAFTGTEVKLTFKVES